MTHDSPGLHYEYLLFANPRTVARMLCRANVNANIATYIIPHSRSPPRTRTGVSPVPDAPDNRRGHTPPRSAPAEARLRAGYPARLRSVPLQT